MHIAKRFLKAGLLLGSVVAPVAAQASDLILVNGRIYTAAAPKWAEAIAVTGNTIEAVGSNAQVLKTRTAKTQVVDLKGQMVIPGVTDNHTHPWFGSLALTHLNLTTEFQNIRPDTNRAEYIARIKAYAAAHPAEPIIFVRSEFDRHPGPALAILDEAEPNKPLVVHHVDEHWLWVNSKALALAGITDKPLPDPLEESYVERDAGGHPTGVLDEAAMEVMERALPPMPMDEQVRILEAGEHYLNSMGVTSAAAMTGGLDELRAWDAIRKRGELTLRVRQSFGAVAVNHHMTDKFLADLELARTTWHDDWLSANIVKFFMDGDPTPPLYKAADYNALVKELDKRGYYMVSHALTPEGVKMALDGYQAAQEANGQHDARFRLTHGERINPEDMPRLAKLHVVLSTQPAFCCEYDGKPGQMDNPWRSVMNTGATVVFDSDWPCSWPPSPIDGIEQAANRWIYRQYDARGPVGSLKHDHQPGEAVSPEDALIAYTRTAAYANHTEAKLGTLEAGKLADIVVLTKNILELPKEQISSARVSATIVGGKLVYGTL
ncbi:amidohydrolase [Novosphingobium sp.]|uniref:amidohydrolase n=1 Tax=Novosphingobium sp. TaxID=1874826 RepID=UPI003B526034